MTIPEAGHSLADLLALAAAEGRDDVDPTGAVLRTGWENLVLETRDGWILRFPRPGVDFERELAVLAAVAGRLPVATPEVVWTGRRSRFAAYRRLTGAGFDPAVYERASTAERDRLTLSLADFLAAMHTCLSPTLIAELGIPAAWGSAVGAELATGPEPPEGPVSERLAAQLPLMPSAARKPVEALIEEYARAWEDGGVQGPEVLLHNDFHAGNFVLDAPVGVLAGVWDFSCVARGRPTADLRYFADGSPDLLHRLADAYERRTGWPMDVRAAVVALRAENVCDELELGHPERIGRLAEEWGTP
ncbi:Predicted kinase, aminoglycoside phosphotransferase (APT) family [Actinopolymorpha cephalotaxi]|nr:aminoglycoside phosphotransferase family protein [Actinopolymorpha cephalotaxi]SFG21970.1 Predicted kinase, aminoglycoside phosphotransferase (APT) family [Actinopolymorpha cephalotaxi]